MSYLSPSWHIYCQPAVLNTPSTSQPSSLVLDESLGKRIPACIKRPMNSNLALPPPMHCESVVHNALQQQDRGNYHNQRRGASISGEPQGVNEAERRKRRERWVSAWERETEGGGEGEGWAPLCWFPQNSKASCQKIATCIINHSEKIYLSTLSLFLSLSFHIPLFSHNLLVFRSSGTSLHLSSICSCSVTVFSVFFYPCNFIKVCQVGGQPHHHYTWHYSCLWPFFFLLARQPLEHLGKLSFHW